jgi:hypothetical protein
MKTKIITIVAAGMLLGASPLASADIVSLDLFDLGCQTLYDSNSSVWTTNFDLGVTFMEISNVYIDWAGEITGGLAMLYSNPEEPFPFDVSINAYLDMPVDAGVSIWGGEATYPNSEPFDCQLDFELFGLGSWSDLLEGQGTIWFFYEELIIIKGSYIESGSIVLDRANLIVEGVPVPEPTAFLFIIIGVIGIRKA